MRLAAGSVFAEKYEVLRELSEGAGREVYAAEERGVGTRRALRVLPPTWTRTPELRARFLEEARVSAQIESEHVLVVFDAGVDAGTGAPWVATELVAGESLEQRVRRAGPLATAELRQVLGAVCEAIDAAHAVGVTHGSLQPGAVHLGAPDGDAAALRALVQDFGLAGLEPAPLVAADVAWKAPEQLGEGGITGSASDLWAIGLLAFFAAKGRPYWTVDADLPAALREVTAAPIEAPSARAPSPALGPAFDAWFARCVNRDPKQRFRTAGEAFEQLVQALAKAPAGQGAGPERTVLLDDAARAAADAAIAKAKGGAPAGSGPSPATAPSAEPRPAPPAEAPGAKPASKPKSETTMTVGVDVAPGFSAEELVAQHKAARAAKAAAAEVPKEPAPDAPSESVRIEIPYVPLPPKHAPIEAPPPKGGSGWAIAIGIAVVVLGGVAFGVWRLASSTPVVSIPPLPSVRSAPPVPAAPSDSAKKPDDDGRAARARAAGAEWAKRVPQVPIAGATFLLGSTDGGNDERPPTKTTVAPFFIDTTEVTVEEYAACVDAGGCEPAGSGEQCTGAATDRPKRPINCVDLPRAQAFCAWIGRRLPTEAEWELAAKGRAGRKHPWGAQVPDALSPNDRRACWNRCSTREGTCDVGSNPAGKTPEGVFDLGGNVAEWTQSRYCPYDKPDCGEATFVTRGGHHCTSEAALLRTTARHADPPSAESANLGFRCAQPR